MYVVSRAIRKPFKLHIQSYIFIIYAYTSGIIGIKLLTKRIYICSQSLRI